MEYSQFSWTAGARKHRVSRSQIRQVIERAELFYVRPASPPGRPDEALLFLGDDEHGVRLEIVGVELADGAQDHSRDADAGQLRRPVRGGEEEVAAVNDSGSSTTKAGTRLDADYERLLRVEAEAGFDPAKLSRRRAGRPSLSGRAGHSNRVDLRVDDETYAAILRIADQNNRKISDVVRAAIKHYLEAG